MKAGFILLSPPEHPIPSTRVAVLNMLPLLAERGVECEILFAPAHGSERPELPLDAKAIATAGFDVVCFQKVHGPSAEGLTHALRAEGVATVFLVCDVIDARMCEATDVTATVTDFLKSLYPAPLQHKIQVVHDGIERPEVTKFADATQSREKLEAVLVTSAHLTSLPVIGHPPPWLRVTIVGPYAADWRQRLRQDWWTFQKLPGTRSRFDFLRFLLSRRLRRVTWSPDGVYEELCRADVGIIPIQSDENPPSSAATAPLWMRKSENRATLNMAVGLPVVATPIPAYEPVIRSGDNGYLARNRSDWIAALTALRQAHHREAMGRQARTDVLQRFSMQAQCGLLLDAFENATRAVGRCVAEKAVS